jgi:hypothetical protein
LPSGTHQVEFHFEPPQAALYVSLTAVVIGLFLAGAMLWCRNPALEPSVKPVPIPHKLRLPPHILSSR